MEMEFKINAEFLTKEEREFLRKLEEKTREKSMWKPCVNDMYWYIRDFMDFDNDRWVADDTDYFRWSIGNVFKSEEEAKFAVEKLRVVAELKRYAKKHNGKINWENEGSGKWFIVYDFHRKKITIPFTYGKSDGIYFSSEEIAKNAIEEIGEEKIIKYYLEIK